MYILNSNFFACIFQYQNNSYAFTLLFHPAKLKEKILFNYFCVFLLIQGNDVIHQMTKDKNQVLRVEVQSFSGEKGYAEYSTFIVGDEQSKYKLTVAGYKGNIGKHLRYRNIKEKLWKIVYEYKKTFFSKYDIFYLCLFLNLTSS